MPGDADDLPAGCDRVLGNTSGHAMSSDGNAVPGSGDQVPRDQHAVSVSGDRVSRDRIAMPAESDCLPHGCERNAVSRDGYAMPGDEHEVPCSADVLPRGGNNLPADGYQVSKRDHSHALSAGADVLPRGSDVVPADGYAVPRYGYKVSGGDNEVSAAGDAVPGDAVDVSAAFADGPMHTPADDAAKSDCGRGEHQGDERIRRSVLVTQSAIR